MIYFNYNSGDTMAKKKVTKTAKRRLTIITPIVFLAIGYCAFTLVTTMVSIYNLNREEASLKKELTELKAKSKDLKTEIDKLQDKDYVARYARENYLYTKDGEYVIKALDAKEKKVKDKFEITEEQIILLAMITGSLILFYIVFKGMKKRKKKGGKK